MSRAKGGAILPSGQLRGPHPAGAVPRRTRFRPLVSQPPFVRPPLPRASYLTKQVVIYQSHGPPTSCQSGVNKLFSGEVGGIHSSHTWPGLQPCLTPSCSGLQDTPAPSLGAAPHPSHPAYSQPLTPLPASPHQPPPSHPPCFWDRNVILSHPVLFLWDALPLQTSAGSSSGRASPPQLQRPIAALTALNLPRALPSLDPDLPESSVWFQPRGSWGSERGSDLLKVTLAGGGQTGRAR